jgi:hypothetical protein
MDASALLRAAIWAYLLQQTEIARIYQIGMEKSEKSMNCILHTVLSHMEYLCEDNVHVQPGCQSTLAERRRTFVARPREDRTKTF